MDEPAVYLEGVCKRLGRRDVLHGIRFSMRPGECAALVGGNGAGKTTTLKVLLDFQHPDAGRVEIFGIPNREPRSRERLVFLPERFVPPQHLSGREFLEFMRRLHGRPRDAQLLDARIAALEFPVEALDRPVRAYSKGMGQKLGLIACLASGRDLLVLDEPMSGLDPKARILVRRQLESLVQAGHTLLFTTHSLADAEVLCQRIAILVDGRVVFHDSPRVCRERFQAGSLEEAYLRCLDAVAGEAAY
jgi:ABC-2 type transport system ATP-binding protein